MSDGVTTNLPHMTIEVNRGAGHPWTSSGPYDQVMVRSVPHSALESVKKRFEAKYWALWFEGSDDTDFHDLMFYKPTGHLKPYQESKKMVQMVIRGDFSFLDKNQ